MIEMNRIIDLESNIIVVFLYNIPQHRPLAANAWNMLYKCQDRLVMVF